MQTKSPKVTLTNVILSTFASLSVNSSEGSPNVNRSFVAKAPQDDNTVYSGENLTDLIL